eukprot:scaffold111851_cov20-Tisochrysis_lutea.AAC.4
MREATRCSPSDVSFSKRPCHAAVKEDEFGSHTDSTSKYTSSELQPAAGRACSKAPGLILVWAAGASGSRHRGEGKYMSYGVQLVMCEVCQGKNGALTDSDIVPCSPCHSERGGKKGGMLCELLSSMPSSSL